MWQRNNGQTEEEKLQNRFTSYLLTAVRRRQKDYITIKNQQAKFETPAEKDSVWFEYREETDMLKELPLLMQLESNALTYALNHISEREKYVFLARVLYDISFEELGAELGLGYKGVAAVYYRVISKIKKEMKEAGENEF